MKLENVDFCGNGLDYNDVCISGVAAKTQNPLLCNKIIDESKRDLCIIYASK